MSENEKKPENLMLEVRYDDTSVSYTQDNLSVSRNHYGEMRDTMTYLRYVIAPKIDKLLFDHRCGITVEPARTSDCQTLISVYRLDKVGPRSRHVLYCPTGTVLEDWLLYDAIWPFNPRIVHVPFNLCTGEALGDDVNAKRRATRDEDPIPDVATVAELAPGISDIKTRIAALKGAFALATGQYDDVTEADIQAATVAGYANPEVLVGVKDATWLMVEKHRDEAWSEGYAKGYESKTETIEGDLDKWMQMLGAGIMGHQAEAYVVLDAAIEELVSRRADAIATRGYTMVSVPNTEPPTDLPFDEYKAEMRSLHLRQQRAETLRSELKAGQLIEDIGEPWVNDYLFSARNWGGPNQKLDSAE